MTVQLVSHELEFYLPEDFNPQSVFSAQRNKKGKKFNGKGNLFALQINY